jgi:hypothetical protein
VGHRQESFKKTMTFLVLITPFEVHQFEYLFEEITELYSPQMSRATGDFAMESLPRDPPPLDLSYQGSQICGGGTPERRVAVVAGRGGTRQSLSSDLGLPEELTTNGHRGGRG